MAAAGVAQGLPPGVADLLASRTVTGAGELLRTSSLSAAELRENVTSPGGTTAAGLSILMDTAGLKDLIGTTIAAAARRSRELSQ
jgi:pyrroline-5-carboxylate reductase